MAGVDIVNQTHVFRVKDYRDIQYSKLIKSKNNSMDSRYSEPNMFEGVYAELRAVMTIRELLNKDLGRIKAKTRKNIDKYFFELFKCFKEWVTLPPFAGH